MIRKISDKKLDEIILRVAQEEGIEGDMDLSRVSPIYFRPDEKDKNGTYLSLEMEMPHIYIRHECPQSEVPHRNLTKIADKFADEFDKAYDWLEIYVIEE